jgi:prepilin-type N-terminal cleavage/methylation domain-containing protein
VICVRRPSCGFSYIEVLVAVALLAICAYPLADAIKNGLGAAAVGENKAQELRCMKNMMETVLAEPFDNLLAAANGSQATSYSRPAGNDCGVRNVYIAKYEHRINSAPQEFEEPASVEDTLLLVTVSAPEPGYIFATLVDR